MMTLFFHFLSLKEKLLESKTMNGFERITSVKDMAMRDRAVDFDRIDKGMKLVSEKVRKEIYYMYMLPLLEVEYLTELYR